MACVNVTCNRMGPVMALDADHPMAIPANLKGTKLVDCEWSATTLLAESELAITPGKRSLLAAPELTRLGQPTHHGILLLIARGHAFVTQETSKEGASEIITLTSAGKSAHKLFRIKAAHAARSQ